MGLLGKMVTVAVAKKVGTAAMHSVDKHMQNTRSADAIVNNNSYAHKLFIKKKDFSIKRGFAVTDEFDLRKYSVKTDVLNFGYPCVRLLDVYGNEVGNVRLTSKTGMGTYTMYMHGQECGTLTRRVAVKVKLDLSCKGWHLEGNLLQNSFIVTDAYGHIVIRFDNAYEMRETYVLQMGNRDDEIIALLLLMAVEIALHGND